MKAGEKSTYFDSFEEKQFGVTPVDCNSLFATGGGNDKAIEHSRALQNVLGVDRNQHLKIKTIEKVTGVSQQWQLFHV